MSDLPPEDIETAIAEDPSIGSFDGFFDNVEFNLPPDEENISKETEEAHPLEGLSDGRDGDCIVCGAAVFRPPGLTRSGSKKRVPKYCNLHSQNVPIQNQRSRTKGVESQLRNVQEELADDLRLLATLAGPLLPVTGMFVFEQADPFTIALLKLAKNNQTVLRILHRTAQVAPIYTVAQTLAGTAYAVQVDIQKADPHNMIGKRLGVERAYDLVHGEEQQQSVNGSVPFQGPPRYSNA